LKKRRIKNNFLKVFSTILSVSMVISSIPVSMGVSAAEGDEEVVIPTKESEGNRYKPEFSYDEDFYNAIVEGVSGVKTINKLPSYEDFVAKTGYKNSTGIPLTKFRETYGAGSEFTAPTEDVTIFIVSSDELDLLASLVNGTDGTTDSERAYYSKASYKLIRNIKSTNNRFIPIGTKNNSFNGVFNGNGFEISNINISGDSANTYSGVEHFGLFGYIGKNGTVKGLGITNCNIKLPYVVGADVGVLAGRNYGTVEDCYINGKLNTKVIVSNSTVGGIAENYGTIKGMYADFYAKVSMTEASYSDPQPIATVNKGTVENCYYIRWKNKHPEDTYTVEDDNGDNEYLVGWADDDYTNFNGTGVSDEDLVTLKNVNLPNFVNGEVAERKVVVSGKEYTLSAFRDVVGRGVNFDKSKADEIFASEYGNKLSIMSSDWRDFCDLVNGNGCTEEEQKYYSTAEVYLGGTPESQSSYGYTNPRSYDYMSITGASSRNYTLGTSKHPFNGVINGNNCKIYLYDGTKPVFGVLGANAKVKDVLFDGYVSEYNAYTTDTPIFCDTNKGVIENCKIEYAFNFYAGDEGNLLSDADFTNVLGKLSFVKTNKGTIKDCSAAGYGSYNTKNAAGNYTTTNKGYFNVVGSSTGTVTNLKVNDSIVNFNGIGTKDSSVLKGETLSGVAQPFTFGSSTYTVKFISKYPTVGLYNMPTVNSEGKYQIYTPEDLNYFIKYGKGESLVLMNTIDMCNYIYDGSDKGYFDIDGKLTNEDDISSYIDLGTGIKCYSILNLNIDGALSKSFSGGKGSWSNIYFIGGNVNLVANVDADFAYIAELCETTDIFGDVDYKTDFYTFILGDSITNVHYSFNIDYSSSYDWSSDTLSKNRLIGPDGYTADEGERYICFAKKANLCSSGGNVDCKNNGYGSHNFDLIMLGKESTKCDSYANIVDGDVYCIGYDVSYSKTHAQGNTNSRAADTYRYSSSYGADGYNYIYTPAYMVDSIRGMGKNVSNSVYDGTLDVNHAMKYIFGDNVSNCVYSGNIDTAFPIFKDNISGLVFSEDGIISGAFEGMSGENILFKGTLKANNVIVDEPSYSKYKCEGSRLFNKAKNVINDGKIIVDAEFFGSFDANALNRTLSTTTVDIYGMGKDVDGIMNGTFEIEGNSDTMLDVALLYYGSGEGVNYADINFHDTGAVVKYVYVFRRNIFSPCENYGKVNISDGVENLYIADSVNDFINYADISTSGVTNLSVITPYSDRYTIGKNYGNIKMNVTNEYSTFSVIRDIYGSRYPHIDDNTYNVGNVEIYSSNEDEVGMLGYTNSYTSLGYDNKDNAMFICYSTNYGDVNIHDVAIKNTVFYLTESAFYGNCTFENVAFDKSSIVGSKLGYRKKDYVPIYNNEEYENGTVNFDSVNTVYPLLAVKNCSGTVRLSNGMLALSNNDFDAVTVSEIPFINGKYEDVDLGGNNKANEFIVYYSSGKILAHDMDVKVLRLLPYSEYSNAPLLIYDANISSTLQATCCGLSDVVIKDSSIANIRSEMFASSPTEDNKYTICNAVNYGNLSISNINNVLAISINQDSKTNSNTSFINTGNIKVSDISTVLVNGNDNAILTVSGICGKFDINQTDTGMLNTGNIDVAFDGDILVSGVGGNITGSLNDVLINCINTGDIKVLVLSKDPEAVIKVGGISCRETKDANGLINWGNIEVTGANLSYGNNVTITSLVDVFNRLANGINYGNVTVNDSDSNDETSDYDFLNIGVYTSSYYRPFNRFVHIEGQDVDTVKALCNVHNVLNYGTITVNSKGTSSREYFYGATISGYLGWDEEKQVSYLDYEPSIVNVNTSCTSGLNMNGVDAPEDILKPGYAYRYYNLTEDKYLSVSKKLQYSGDKDFEYADKDELRGALASYIKENYPSMTGAYAVTMTGYEKLGDAFTIVGNLGGNLEDSIKITDVNKDKIVKTKWGNMSIPTLLSTKLKQRDENTWVEFGWIGSLYDSPFMSSVDKYSRKTGTNEQISEKSTLISRQEPVRIKVGKKRVIPANTIVTEMSMYMPLDDFDLSKMDFIKFKVNGYIFDTENGVYVSANGNDGEPLILTKNSSFKVFKEPVVISNMYSGIKRDDYNSDDAYNAAISDRLGEKISYLFDDENDALLSKEFSVDKSFDLHLSEEMLNNEFSLVLGIAIAEDGRRTNLLVLNVIPKTILPSGSVYKVSYPTGISSDAKSLTDAYFANAGNVITDFDDNSTLSYGVSESNGVEWRYPVYTMNTKMYHVTDGAYINKYEERWQGRIVGYQKGNAITNNSTVSLGFSSKNIKDFSVYVDDVIYTDSAIKAKGNLRNSDFSISEDGATVDVVDKSLILSPSLLLSGGEHVIEIRGLPYYGSDNTYCTVLKVIINREKSPENYIKSKYFNRSDILHSDSSSSKEITTKVGATLNPIVDLDFTDPRYMSSATYSSKASVNKSVPYGQNYYSTYYSRPSFAWDSVEFSDYVKPEGIDTYYPTKMLQKVDITAENGDVATYSIQKTISNKLDKVALKGIISSNGGQSAGSTYILPQNELKVSFNADYSNSAMDYDSILSNTKSSPIKYIKVYNGAGELVYTAYPISTYNSVRNPCWGGMRFSLSSNGSIYVRTEVNSSDKLTGYLNEEEFVDDYYTFVPVLNLGKLPKAESFGSYRSSLDYLPSDIETEEFCIELDPFVISKTKLSIYRAISVNWDNTLVTSAISTLSTELTNDVDIYGDGVIDYSNTSDETNTFYINNCVEPSCSGDTIKVDVPATATLQEKVNGEWVSVFESRVDNHVFSKNISYPASELSVGIRYNFRIIAQDYDESDSIKKNHVAYYNTTITATVRNKDISIEFDDGDETMSLYREILNDNGNTAIQIKNMNGADAILQQTKLYTGTSESDMKSSFYKLAQGDYAIDVQVPSGYNAKVKIVGGSSEGYLIPSKVVKGDRLRLPYANAQSIKLVVYLEKETVSSDWGVTYNKSLFKNERVNKI